ncbi:MAG: stage 0 sporulation family protein [Oscillospiraceae bacterium]|nr:stage 0 sporulation family protein [Oscillospiraceae bacterium]
MTEVIGVRLRGAGKIYYFDPAGQSIDVGSHVIVETIRGVEYGEVVKSRFPLEDKAIESSLKPIVRLADENDAQIVAQNEQEAKKAMEICARKILKHNLAMKLVDAEYTFDRGKLLFYFTADGRVDFRELVKDLASEFRTRIELRQIGVRDEARLLGGLGVCGRPFCCSTFLDGFQPVSIKMAKEQNLSLNPVKISGTCGRLMCCLKYEHDVYAELLRLMPNMRSVVSTPEGRGVVVDQNIIGGTVSVRLDKQKDASPKVFPVKKIKVLREAREDAMDKREMDALKKLERD